MSDQHILPRAPTSKKLHEALKLAFGPIPVGLGAAPRVDNLASGPVASAPYVVLLPLWANIPGQGWGQDRHADAEWIYQVDHYAARGDQLEGMRDRTFGVMLGKTADAYVVDLSTETVKITERELRQDDGMGDAVGSVLPSQVRFALLATPNRDALVGG